ncbi:MAG: ABC transporter substrate-binding protein [Candidatus Hermodarchaeia archaeon]|jgi:ABC-type transport system substrate-binding protein
MGIAKRNLFIFCSVILITLIGTMSLYSPETTLTSRADWTYPDGYDPHGGYLDKVTFVVYPREDEQLGLQALQANIIYAWDERVPADNIAELETTAGVEVTTEPGDMYRMFCLNCNKFPTNITGYRRAMAYALDKGAVIQNSTGGLAFFQDCAIPITLGNWTYETQLSHTYYTRDLIAANESLEAAGFRDLNGNGWRDYDADNSTTFTAGDVLDVDFEIEMFHTAGHKPSTYAVEIAAESLNLCGIMARAAPMDFYDMLDFITDGDYWLMCFTFTDMNTATLLYDFFHSSTGNNQWYFGGWTNDTYDQYAENLMIAPTLEEANHWAWKCQELLWYEQPMIVCYNDVYTHAYRRDIWEGYINMQGRNRIGNGCSLVHIRLKEEAGGPFGCYPTEYIMSLNEGLDTPNYLMSNSKHSTKVFQLIYEQLWTYSPYDWTPQPSLAYAWETELTNASGDIQDGEKYTFHLFENATWHDGIPVSAEDVAYSLVLGQQKPYRFDNYQHVYKTNVVDNTTIEIYTNKTGYFEWTRATGFVVFPEHIWSVPTNVTTFVPTPAECAGTGPYVFTAHVPGQYVVLERHSDWHFAVPQPPRTPCHTPTINDGWFWGRIISICIWIIIIQSCILCVLLVRRSRKSSKKLSDYINE